MSKKIRESARGEQCQIRILGVCNHNPATTVLCHQGGAGMGIKHLDCEAAYGCSDCHDVVDGRHTAHHKRILADHYGADWRVHVRVDFENGQRRTRRILVEKDLLVLK